MKKKHLILAFIATALLFSFPLFAEERIIDNAGILSAGSKAALETLMEDIASKYNFNLIILTERSINDEDAIDYSWNYLDSRGLDGYTWDGCLLLQSTGERDYAITASGRGEKILNEAAYDKLEKDVVDRLREDDYSGAYEVFISKWEKLLVLESKGQKYNFLQERKMHVIFLGAAWLLALMIGSMIVSGMKAQMNTALPKTQADAYMVPGSLALTNQMDRFLYSTTTKRRRESSSSGGGSSYGGSSRSGGGRSSRSGKY